LPDRANTLAYFASKSAERKKSFIRLTPVDFLGGSRTFTDSDFFKESPPPPPLSLKLGSRTSEAVHKRDSLPNSKDRALHPIKNESGLAREGGEGGREEKGIEKDGGRMSEERKERGK